MTLTIEDEDRLTKTFAALANPTRRAILAHLARGAATVNELAAPFELKPVPVDVQARFTDTALALDQFSV